MASPVPGTRRNPRPLPAIDCCRPRPRVRDACLDHAVVDAVPDGALAVVEGEHDGASYHWIVRLTGDRHVYMTGGCDYTGWD